MTENKESINANAGLLQEISSFCEKHGVAESRLGRDALNRSEFVGDLRAGNITPTLKTVVRLQTWMAHYSPKPEEKNA